MNTQTKLIHVAINCCDKEKTNLFFTTILGMSKSKSFTLSRSLSEEIFDKSMSVDVEVFENGECAFEVFYHDTLNSDLFSHVCLELPDKKNFFDKCRLYGLSPISVCKNGKQLYFIRDFSNNLYELKFKC